MADPHVISALERKRDEIEKAITAYERKLKQAKRDLSHVNASLRLFKIEGERLEFPVHVDIHRLFKRGELATLCKEALAKEGPLDTRELARRVVKAKGLDQSDDVLRQSITYKIVQALRLQAKRDKIVMLPKRKGVRVWSLIA